MNTKAMTFLCLKNKNILSTYAPKYYVSVAELLYFSRQFLVMSSGIRSYDVSMSCFPYVACSPYEMNSSNL